MEDLEVFVYGMAKKDAMVDASAIVLKEELLEDDKFEVIIIILSYYHIIILSYYHIIILSYYHIIILSYYHIIIL